MTDRKVHLCIPLDPAEVEELRALYGALRCFLGEVAMLGMALEEAAPEASPQAEHLRRMRAAVTGAQDRTHRLGQILGRPRSLHQQREGRLQ